MKKQLLRVAVVGVTASLLLLGGCTEKKRRNYASSVAPSTTAPVNTGFAVLTSTPADGATDVPVDTTFYVTFSADVEATSLNGAVLLSNDRGPVAADVQLTTPRVVSVRPLANMVSATPHLLRITTGVLDSQGAALASEELIKFDTSSTVPISGPGTPTPVAPATPGNYTAGASSVDITPPIGVPLAGFGGGHRRHTPLPDFNPFDYHTFLNPSTGIKDPIMAKVLVIDNGHERVAIVTLDAIATEANLVEEAVKKAAAQGFTVPLEKVLVCASHTHSGPGAVSRKLMWQVIAADLFVSRVFNGLTDKIATAMVQAEQSMGAAQIGVSSVQVTTATRNRRASDSPLLNPDSIDPEMVVIRVDRANGTPLATVWNFAIHGTHFGTGNMEYSADIMGSANIKAEAAGAGISMFINGCEGDIKPTGGYDATGQILADAIMNGRNAATTSPAGVLQSAHEMIDLGQPKLSLALHRSAPPSIAGSSFVQGLTRLGIVLGFDFSIPKGWMEHEFRFQAIRLGKTVISSAPGEPIHGIGLQIKQDGIGMGFDKVMVAGLANGHGSYFTTDQEFQFGGYEGMASLFGANNGTLLMDAMRRVMRKVKP